MSIDITEHAISGLKAELEDGKEDYFKLLAIKAMEQQQAEIYRLNEIIDSDEKYNVREKMSGDISRLHNTIGEICAVNEKLKQDLEDAHQSAKYHEDLISGRDLRISELEKASEWISVEDRLPTNDNFMNTYGKRGMSLRPFNIHYRCWDDEEGDDYYCKSIGEEITHWRPLPKPPEGES